MSTRYPSIGAASANGKEWRNGNNVIVILADLNRRESLQSDVMVWATALHGRSEADVFTYGAMVQGNHG
jgi:hypothetical protein